MGQKVNPIGLRLGIVKSWNSIWFEEKQYAKWLHEDIALRNYLKKELQEKGLSHIDIERAASKTKVTIHTSRPG
ncbi:MAG: 30S ribosomal protein S3, partial [Deltaproteobacteria bacterium]|nr:30S ribosomal protein S3 [Deltaproteobacteria bacterium]